MGDGILYYNCDCNVWPIQFYNAWGRCGRCGIKPEDGPYRTRAEATEAFRYTHQKDPLHERLIDGNSPTT